MVAATLVTSRCPHISARDASWALPARAILEHDAARGEQIADAVRLREVFCLARGGALLDQRFDFGISNAGAGRGSTSPSVTRACPPRLRAPVLRRLAQEDLRARAQAGPAASPSATSSPAAAAAAPAPSPAALAMLIIARESLQLGDRHRRVEVVVHRRVKALRRRRSRRRRCAASTSAQRDVQPLERRIRLRRGSPSE